MKKRTLLFLALTFSLISLAQIDTTEVPFLANWSLGDSYNFSVTKIQQEWKVGEEITSDTTQFDANFQVIDSNEFTYKIRWLVKNNVFLGEQLKEIVDKLDISDSVEVIYTTNAQGVFICIDNWLEISESLQHSLQEMISLIKNEEGGNPEEIEKMIMPFLSMVSSKEAIESLIFPEIRLFHFPFGVSFDVNEPFTYEDQIPNITGGAPLRADARLYFESVDFEKKQCVFHQESKLNPEDTKELIGAIVSQIKIADSADFNKALKESIFKITTANRFEYFYDPGIPVRIETRRESVINIESNGGTRIDGMIIQLL